MQAQGLGWGNRVGFGPRGPEAAHELGVGGLGGAGQDSGTIVLEASSPMASARQTRNGLAVLSSRQRVGCDIAYLNNEMFRGPEIVRSSLPSPSHSSGNVHRSSCGPGLWLLLRKQRGS